MNLFATKIHFDRLQLDFGSLADPAVALDFDITLSNGKVLSLSIPAEVSRTAAALATQVESIIGDLRANGSVESAGILAKDDSLYVYSIGGDTMSTTFSGTSTVVEQGSYSLIPNMVSNAALGYVASRLL